MLTHISSGRHTSTHPTSDIQRKNIREMFSDGSSMNYIARRLGVSDQTVKRYTADMPQPAPRKPLTVIERSELMQRWL